MDLAEPPTHDLFLAVCSRLICDYRTLSRLSITCWSAYKLIHCGFLVSELVTSQPRLVSPDALYSAKFLCVSAKRNGWSTEELIEMLDQPEVIFSDPYIEKCIFRILKDTKPTQVHDARRILERAGWQIAPAPAYPSMATRLHSLYFYAILGLRPKRISAMYHALGLPIVYPVARSWLLLTSFLATLTVIALTEHVGFMEIGIFAAIKIMTLLGDLILEGSSRDIAILLPLAVWKISSVISVLMGLANDFSMQCLSDGPTH